MRRKFDGTLLRARDYNGCLAQLKDHRVVSSPTTRVQRHRDGYTLELRPEVRAWKHPWQTTARWNAKAERWEAQVEPGMVNGRDVEVGSGKSEDGSDAWMPLRSFRSGMAQEAGEVKVFFSRLGVRDEEENVRIDTVTGSVQMVAPEEEDEDAPPPRQLMACDFYLAKARATFAAEVTVVDGSGISGQVVDYAVRYDTTQLDRVGTRTRLRTAAVFPQVLRPTLQDRLMGNYQDDGEDRLRISTVFFLSPPDWEGPLDGSWTAFSQHHVFWNLRHMQPNAVPKVRPKPIRFFSGLAGGFGDVIINQNLALNDEIAGRVLGAINNTTPEGRFSIV